MIYYVLKYRDISMNKNIKLLLVKNGDAPVDHDLIAAIESLDIHKFIQVEGSKDALKEFVNDHAKQPFNVTLICELANKEETKLLESLMEIDPQQYIVMLYNDISAEKVLASVQHGASGILNRPFSADKIRMELEKYSLMREDKQAMNS